MQEYTFIIDEINAGERVDKVLSLLISDKSRSYIQKQIKEGHVLVNGKAVKPSEELNMDDCISCMIPDPALLQVKARDIPINIVYEDDDVLIVNKEKGMVVHPAAGHYDDTLVNAIMFHCKDNLSGINGVLRPGIVHRIDKDTTGLLVVCKNDFAHSCVAEQLKDHSGERCYHAICKGILKDDEFVIDKPIGRDTNDRKKMSINPNGKNAVTHVKVLKRLKNATYIECRLETGRTHQIRVHLSSIGHPLLGDNLYGDLHDKYRPYGQVLHAKTLGFIHPSTKEFVSFDSELPKYFTDILHGLGFNE